MAWPRSPAISRLLIAVAATGALVVVCLVARHPTLHQQYWSWKLESDPGALDGLIESDPETPAGRAVEAFLATESGQRSFLRLVFDTVIRRLPERLSERALPSDPLGDVSALLFWFEQDGIESFVQAPGTYVGGGFLHHSAFCSRERYTILRDRFAALGEQKVEIRGYRGWRMRLMRTDRAVAETTLRHGFGLRGREPVMGFLVERG